MLPPLPGGLKRHSQVTGVTHTRHTCALKMESQVCRERGHGENSGFMRYTAAKAFCKSEELSAKMSRSSSDINGVTCGAVGPSPSATPGQATRQLPQRSQAICLTTVGDIKLCFVSVMNILQASDVTTSSCSKKFACMQHVRGQIRSH